MIWSIVKFSIKLIHHLKPIQAMMSLRCVLKPTGHPTFRIPPPRFPPLLASLSQFQSSHEAYRFLRDERQRLYQSTDCKQSNKLTPLAEASIMVERMSIEHKLSILDSNRSNLQFRPWLFDMDRSELNPNHMYQIMDEAIRVSAKTWLEICKKEGIRRQFVDQLTKVKEKGLLYGELKKLQDLMVKQLQMTPGQFGWKLRQAVLLNSIFGFRPQLRFSKEGVMGQIKQQQAKLDKALSQASILKNLGCWFGGVVLANCNHQVYLKFMQKLKAHNLLNQLAIIPLIQDKNDLASLIDIAQDYVKHASGPFTAMMAKSDSAVNNGINRFSMSFEFARALRTIRKTHKVDVSIDFGTGSSGPRFGPIQFHSAESTVNYFGKLIHMSGAVEFCRTLQGQQFIFYDGNLVEQINKDIIQKTRSLKEQDQDGQICTAKYNHFLALNLWQQLTYKSQTIRKELVLKGSRFHRALTNIINMPDGINTLANYGSRGQLHPEIEKFPNLRAIQLVQIYTQLGIFPELLATFFKLQSRHKTFLISQYNAKNAIIQTLLQNYWFIKEKFSQNFALNKRLRPLCPIFDSLYAENEEAVGNLEEILKQTVQRGESIAQNKHIQLKLSSERNKKVPHYR